MNRPRFIRRRAGSVGPLVALGLSLTVTACSSSSTPSGKDAGASKAPTGPVAWNSLVGGGGLFAQTFDNVSWSVRDLGAKDLYSVTCASRQSGWAGGADGLVVTTSDGGQHWTTQSVPFATDVRAIVFGNPEVGVVAGDGGALAVTHDGGLHWSGVRVTTANLRGAAVTESGSTMLVVGDGGVMFRSGDTGETWESVRVPFATNLRGASTDDAGKVFTTVDDAGHIWSSADGARAFVLAATAPAPLEAISVSDDGSHELAAGENGTVLVSNGGGAWTPQPSGTEAHLRAAIIVGGEVMDLVGGDDGTLRVSTDQGQSWARVPIATTQPIYGLDDF